MGNWLSRNQIIAALANGPVGYGCGSPVPYQTFTDASQVPTQDQIAADQAACEGAANPSAALASALTQLASLQADYMAYKRNQPSNINRGVFATGTTYNYGDIASFGSPASAYSFASTSPLTGTAAGNPASDNSNANWMLLASAGATGSQGTTGTTGAAGTNAAANDATTTLSAIGNPIPAPAAGTYSHTIVYTSSVSGALADKMYARQTGLSVVTIKNESSFNITLTPNTSVTFDAGQLASYLLSAGDAAVLRADPASASSWIIS